MAKGSTSGVAATAGLLGTVAQDDKATHASAHASFRNRLMPWRLAERLAGVHEEWRRSSFALRSARGVGAGMARQLEHFDNLVSLFLTRAREKGDKPFLWAKREGAWRSISWSEAARQVAALAASLQRIGLQPGARVALVSENRPEWLIADLGIMAAGCITVPTYTTNTTRDHAHVLGNSGARAVIVSNQKLAKNLVPAVLTSSECHHIIGIEEIRTGQAPEWVSFHRWSDLAS